MARKRKAKRLTMPPKRKTKHANKNADQVSRNVEQPDLEPKPVEPTAVTPADAMAAAVEPENAMPVDVAQSGLFSLPAELRNTIYRLVLVGQAPVKITSTGFTRSALLASSRTIRAEALSIFYLENDLQMDAPAAGLDAFFKFRKTLKWIGPWTTKSEYMITWDLEPHRANLLSWLRYYHMGWVGSWSEAPAELEARGGGQDEIAVSSMFTIVQAMKRQPWAKVQKLLEQQRPLLATIDKRWNEEKRAWDE